MKVRSKINIKYMKRLYSINEWTMDRLIGRFDPCLDLVNDDMDVFTDSYPYIDHRPITLVNILNLPHL